jgi:hypothetical protein
MVQGAQAFMAQAETYQYTFIMVFAKGMFREGARDGPVCFTQQKSSWENPRTGFSQKRE